MNFAQDALINTLAASTRDEIGERLRSGERAQGFTLVSDALWLDWGDWDRHTIISQDGKRIRLVALQAKVTGQGAFTRPGVERIFRQGLVPVLVEPNQMLIDWCYRHNYRHKRIGRGVFRHEIWFPRR